jgi:hypothetical protein
MTSHPAAMAAPLRQVSAGTAPDLTALSKRLAGKDRLLALLERGRLQQIEGRPAASLADFTAAAEWLQQHDEAALVTVRGAGRQAGAMLVNDATLPYAGDGYERVFLHTFQALNYLAAGQLDGAGVEIRLANEEQERARARHEAAISRARREAADSGAGFVESRPEAVQALAKAEAAVGAVTSSFQNAYTFCLSAAVYEMLGQPNDAYIDYKRALEIHPGNRVVQRQLLRLARQLGMGEDLERFRLQFQAEPAAPPAGQGEVAVFYEEGFVPPKVELKFPIPVPDTKLSGFTAAAVPMYAPPCGQPAPLAVARADGERLGETEPVCDVRALAVKALKERLPVILTRQAVRTTLKGLAAHQTHQQVLKSGEGQENEGLATLATLGVSALSYVTENADLRSWLSLPAFTQVLRAPLPAGECRLRLCAAGGGAAAEIGVPIRENRLTLLHVIRAGNRLTCTIIPPAGTAPP